MLSQGGTVMNENKKTLRILCGIFLIVSFVFTLASNTINLINSVKWWNTLSEDLASQMIRSYLTGTVPGWIVAVLLLVAAIFILQRKLKTAGILTLLSGIINLVITGIPIVSLVVLSISAGGVNPLAGIMYVFRFFGAIAVLLFGVAILTQGNSGKIWCIISAVIGVISTILSTVFSNIQVEGLAASDYVKSIGTAFLVTAVPMICVFLARIFLGSYFGANSEKNS